MLPLPILYGFSDFLYYIMCYVLRYRKKVVSTNLSNAFPEKTAQEIKQLTKQSYQYFCDVIVETVKLFSISEKEMRRRIKFRNLDLPNGYFKENRHLILLAGHHANFELGFTALNLLINHLPIAIYKTLANPFFNQKFLESRGQFGGILLPKKKASHLLRKSKESLILAAFASDQLPSQSQKTYWTTFLHQDTGFQLGAEIFAQRLDAVVIFGRMHLMKRGYYEVTFEVLEADPKSTQAGEIMEKYARRLETLIIEEPHLWLWTHRRWKRKRSDYDKIVVAGDKMEL